MLYAILFEDDASKPDMRARYMADHLAFLETHADVVRAAGPLVDARDGSGAGGLWLVEADKPEDAEALCRADPFWPTGLRKSVRILEWRQVFADRKRVL
jgi:uncharacterized protein